MSLVVLIYGASGSGKSTLMEYLTRAGRQYSIHIKGTDRAERNYDGIEIKCVPEVTSANYDYIYETYGYHYGIQRNQIDDAIANHRHHFIICNDIAVIRSIKRDYESRVKVVFHQFDAPKEALLEIQRRRNISDDEIELRLAKTEALYKTFADEGILFDGVLHNHYGDPPEAMLREFEELLSVLANRHGIEEISRETFERLDQIVAKLERDRATRLGEERILHEPGYVFIVMPTRPDIMSLPDTRAAIIRACKAVRMRGGRIDDAEFVGPITEMVHANIRLAEYVVADLTHERPNVYYEVGYANALGKPILLIAEAKTTIHFDLQEHRIVLYSSYVELERALKQWLRALKKTSSLNNRTTSGTRARVRKESLARR
jgi:guanylate kinase